MRSTPAQWALGFVLATVTASAGEEAREPKFTVIERSGDGRQELAEHHYYPKAPTFRATATVGDSTCIADVVVGANARAIDAEWQCSVDGSHWTSVGAASGERVQMVISRRQGGSAYVLIVDWR